MAKEMYWHHQYKFGLSPGTDKVYRVDGFQGSVMGKTLTDELLVFLRSLKGFALSSVSGECTTYVLSSCGT